MSKEIKNTSAGFTKPLLLTPGEDIMGFIATHLGRMTLFGITAFSVLAVLLIFFFVIKEAWPFIASGGLMEFVTSKSWYPESHEAEYGALSIIAGSAYVTIIAMLIATPIGLLCALFLSDISPFGLRQIVKPIIEMLAAIPSVAYGFFAVLVLAPYLQKHFGFDTGTNALNAGIILAVMALPTIISVAEDSISAISRHLREASYALGATRSESLVKVVIPAAHSGIIASIILGMMRAIGETMVVWMASGNANQIPSPWWDISTSVRTMTATIAGDMGETAKGSDHYQALFAMGVLLLAFTFGLNIISEFFVSKVKKSQGGSK
ncbi:MAG: phosphate ABC transporter permease subunit PstC [Sedimentisphaeraceae bacterium JB056]